MKREMVNLGSALLLVCAVLAAGCGSLTKKDSSDSMAGAVKDKVADIVGDKTSDSASSKTADSSTFKSGQDSSKSKTASSLGTIDKPVPKGQTGAVGSDWQIQIEEINPDAWSVIQEENRYNSAPEEGRQYVMATIKVTYTGEKSSKPSWDLGWKYLGSDNLAYTTSCGSYSKALRDVEEMYTGGTAEARVCVSVPSSAVKGGSFIFSDSPYETFFAGVPKS